MTDLELDEVSLAVARRTRERLGLIKDIRLTFADWCRLTAIIQNEVRSALERATNVYPSPFAPPEDVN